MPLHTIKLKEGATYFPKIHLLGQTLKHRCQLQSQWTSLIVSNESTHGIWKDFCLCR